MTWRSTDFNLIVGYLSSCNFIEVKISIVLDNDFINADFIKVGRGISIELYDWRS